MGGQMAPDEKDAGLTRRPVVSESPPTQQSGGIKTSTLGPKKRTNLYNTHSALCKARVGRGADPSETNTPSML